MFQGILANQIADLIIEALNMFFEIEITETMTVGDLLEEWLDIKLSGTVRFPYWWPLIVFLQFNLAQPVLVTEDSFSLH